MIIAKKSEVIAVTIPKLGLVNCPFDGSEFFLWIMEVDCVWW